MFEKSRLVEVADHVQGNPEDPGYLRPIEFPGLQELCVLRIDGQRLELQPLLKDRHPVGILRALIDVIPALPQAVNGRCVLEYLVSLQYSARGSVILKEPPGIFTGRHALRDGFIRHSND